MSLRDAALASGLSHNYIRELEVNKSRVTLNPIKPSFATLRKLSEAYKYPYEELLKIAGYI
ncbi:hypothetical protein HMPREF9413_3347 [Paenibacillus sp. HGF7]|nr:hypothetical protein HMPREF9413_3347 [Paenibacillus sp. HGF7]